eukprot:Rmarinus@m.2748
MSMVALPSNALLTAASDMSTMFRGVRVFFVDSFQYRTNLNVLSHRVSALGGKVLVKTELSTATHIVVFNAPRGCTSPQMGMWCREDVSKSLGCEIPSSAVVVTATWLSDSLKGQRLLSVGDYTLRYRPKGRGDIDPNRSDADDCIPVDHTISPSEDPHGGSIAFSTLPEEGQGEEKRTLSARGRAKTTSVIWDYGCVPLEICKDTAYGPPQCDEGLPEPIGVNKRKSKHKEEARRGKEGKKEDPSSQDTIEVGPHGSNASNDPCDGPQVVVRLDSRVVKNKHTFACQQSTANGLPNLNEHITKHLKILADAYSTSSSNRDDWRVYGYQRVISLLRKLPFKVSSADDIQKLKGVRGIGKNTLEKIEEIIGTGKLTRAEHLQRDPAIQVKEMFAGVFGAGPKTAEKWFSMGFRTLDDLQARAKLTHQQRVGIEYYDDINTRMPRSEAGEIETFVRTFAEQLCPGCKVICCGSYRRKKETCGDCDILLTHPDDPQGLIHSSLLSRLINTLTSEGFLTHNLTMSNEHKYLGLCCLGPGRRHRRIDLIYVPYEELPFALLYFTGSGQFNRSMRLFAHKAGFSLSERSLAPVIRSRGEKIAEGPPVRGLKTERDVFTALGLEYKAPEERNT